MRLEDAARIIRGAEHILLTSHEGPDADGLGAAYALHRGLSALGKPCSALLNGGVPAKFRFIDKAGVFASLAELQDPPFPVGEALLVVVDTQDLGYTGSRMEALAEQARELLVIDHHEIKGAAAPYAYVESAASSTCELVQLILEELGAPIPLDAAEALFAGMVYDTGSFAYPKTGERTFSCARALLALGVEPYAIHTRMYESSAIGVLILQKTVLGSLELLHDNRVAFQTMRRQDLAVSGASYEDAEDLVNIPLQCRSIEVSALFKENLDGKLRCSLRSKGRVNVARIAQKFGGGGHRSAAGFTCDGSLERARADVLQELASALEG